MTMTVSIVDGRLYSDKSLVGLSDGVERGQGVGAGGGEVSEGQT